MPGAGRFRTTAVGIDLLRAGLCLAVPAAVCVSLGGLAPSVPRLIAAAVLLTVSGLLVLGGLCCCCRGPSRRTRLSALFLLVVIPGLGALYAVFPGSLTAYPAVRFLLGLVPIAAFGLLAEGVISASPPGDPVRQKFDNRARLFACCYGVSALFMIAGPPKKVGVLGPLTGGAFGVAAVLTFSSMLGVGSDVARRLARPEAGPGAAGGATGAGAGPGAGAVSPRRRPALGAALMALGWALFLPALLVVLLSGLVWLAGAEIGRSGSVAVLVLAGLCCWAGGSCVALGRRLRARRAEVALSHDPRPPILYLRPFQSDRSWTPEGPPWRMSSTYEEHLARALGRLGPFVAIGRPGERWPELGADRLYVQDEHWQREVQGLMGRAAAVVLAAGDSPGLKWELQEAVARVGPERLLIFVPPAPGPAGTAADRQEAYGRFRRWAESTLPGGLPEQIGSASFIYFAADWAPRLLTPPETPFLLGIRRLRLEVPSQTLQPLLESLLQDPLFLTPMRLGRLVPVAAALPLVGGVFYLVLEKNVSIFVALPGVTLLVLGATLGLLAVLKKL